jgi:HD-like signal output (HDOD) protein
MLTRAESKKRMSNLVRKAEKSELSSLGSIVYKIIEITRSEHSTATHLKDVIELDPPLSSKLLKRANSAHYSISRKISSIQEAIVYMGFNAVKELSLSLKVGDLFKDATVVNGYSNKLLWKHCVGVALCAKNIYRQIYAEKGDMIYSTGLLHEIGIIVEDQYDNKEFKQIIENFHLHGGGLSHFEKETQGFDHCLIARDLTRSWKLPDDMIASITNHHTPLRVDPIYAKPAYTLFIADYLCLKNEIGYADQIQLDDESFNKCCTLMKIDPLALEIIIDDVAVELQKMEDNEEL